MSIWNIGNNKFAAGSVNQRAWYVVKKVGKTFRGVRGQRPVLTKGRFTKVAATKALKAAFA